MSDAATVIRSISFRHSLQASSQSRDGPVQVRFASFLPVFCGHRPPAQWVYADGGAQQHDPSHLLTHRLAAPLPALAAALEGDSRGSPTGCESDDCKSDRHCDCGEWEAAAAAPARQPTAHQEQVRKRCCLDVKVLASAARLHISAQMTSAAHSDL